MNAIARPPHENSSWSRVGGGSGVGWTGACVTGHGRGRRVQSGMSTFGSMTVEQFLAATHAKSPTPGGGAVASAVGALAAALAGMVVSYSVGRKSLAAHEGTLRDADGRLVRARGLMLALADEDAAAYGAVNDLMKRPEGDPVRVAELPAALQAAVDAPMATAAAGVDLLRLMVELAPITNRMLRSDLGIAAVLADATVAAARWNVVINAGSVPEGPRRELLARIDGLLERSGEFRRRVETACGQP